MSGLMDILGGDESFQTSGTLTKLLQVGVYIEEDDDEFQLQPRTSG